MVIYLMQTLCSQSIAGGSLKFIFYILIFQLDLKIILEAYVLCNAKSFLHYLLMSEYSVRRTVFLKEKDCKRQNTMNSSRYLGICLSQNQKRKDLEFDFVQSKLKVGHLLLRWVGCALNISSLSLTSISHHGFS